MKSAVFSRFQARCASSKMTTWSNGGAAAPHALVAEVVHVLDERLHPLPDRALALGPVGARELVAGQCLLQHGDQGPVARQEDGARLAERPAARRDVQADEGLACPGHAGDEDDRLLGRRRWSAR